MSVTARISFEEFQKLQEAADETVHYELDEGELLVTPSPTPWHNIVAGRMTDLLRVFVRTHALGLVIAEMDFRLPAAVRRPDVAFLAKERLSQVDLHHSPIEGAPTLAIEIISPSNFDVDTRKRVRQYRAAGAQAVWLVYPDLHMIAIYDAHGTREVAEPDILEEDQVFGGSKFSLSLIELFDQNPER